MDHERYNHGLAGGEQNWQWVDQYAYEVVTGKILACKNIIRACERHIKDRETKKFYFSTKKINRFIKFCNTLSHTSGELAGKPFMLEPWQIFILGSLFGWLEHEPNPVTGTRPRRFRSADIFVARKNGKSFVASAIMLYGLFMDNEKGAQVISGASTHRQAKIVFEDAKVMLANHELAVFSDITNDEIRVPVSNSKMRAISSDSGAAEGLSAHIAICDEIHTHKNSEIYSVLRRSFGARSQPLMVSISTCGSNMSGIGYQRWKYSEEVLNGISDNDSHFAVLYGIDEEDVSNISNEEIWIKANPNIGVSKKYQTMRDELKECESIVSERNDFILKQLNFWVEGSSSWLDILDLNKCLDDKLALNQLEGQKCVIGLDLSKTADLTAVTLLFPNETNSEFKAFHRHYIPSDALKKMPKEQARSFKQWARNGTLTIQDGNIIDINWIVNDIKKFHEKFDVMFVSYDPYNSTEFLNAIRDESIEAIKIAQNLASLNEPSKRFEKLIKTQALKFPKDDLFMWCCLNATVFIDVNENIKIRKPKEDYHKKIDSVISTINALALLQQMPEQSRYESEGLLLL